MGVDWTLSRSSDVAEGAALMLWQAYVAVPGLILPGILSQEGVSPDLSIAVSLMNPLQAARTAAMALLNPHPALLGLAATGVRSWRFGAGSRRVRATDPA
jgi:ABC-2 type transport system permease protein